MDCKVEIGTKNSRLFFRVQGYATYTQAVHVSQFIKVVIKKEKFEGVAFDLSACEKMDSTFMGIIASLACENEAEAYEVSIVNCSGTALACMEDLGLTKIVTMKNCVPLDEEVTFVPLENIEYGSDDQRDVIYLSHQVLSSINDSNREKFSAVINALNAENDLDS